MNKPRVLVLNHFAVPRGQAGGTRHVELFSRLKGWQYLIIASNLNPQTRVRIDSSPGLLTVPVAQYSSNGISRVLNWVTYAAMAVIRGLRTGRADIVYGSSPHLLTGLAAWVLSVRKGAPFILEIRDLWPRVLVDMGHLDPESSLFKALLALEEFLYARAEIIVVMAEGSRTELLSRGIPEQKIVYIPNGADPYDFTPTAPRKQLRERYNFVRPTAVYAGAHGPANGLHLLIEAAADAPDVDVVLVGGGVLKPQLQTLAERLQLTNVRFLDPVSKSEIPELLGAADFGIHVLADVELFRNAVSPNKVFDYMAAGIPTLTNCPGLVSELVTKARAGIAVEPTGLADGLSRLALMTETQRTTMGSSAQCWISAHQSRDAMAAALESVLDQVAGRHTITPKS